MGQLPRTIPASTLQDLRSALEDAGITLGPLRKGTRVTHTAEHRGATWELTYLGSYYGWRVAGPGVEHGVGADTEEVPKVMNRPVGPQLPDGPLDWAVRAPDGRLWTCDGREAAEETTAEAPHMTAVYRVPGDEWTEWHPDQAKASTRRIPRTYAGVPVPDTVREAWTTHLGDGWRLGIRSALAR
ncbi:hypothetical protein ACFC09_15425 [Streptomyces sp. NPDC056161]|uniref:hypothetical protein n=1 Tax=Streptomyces sp. NPDC056161 TaxID=3345732 RepID=UPI0035D7C07E